LPDQVIALESADDAAGFWTNPLLRITSWSPSTPAPLLSQLGGKLCRSALNRNFTIDGLVSQDCEGNPRHLVGEGHGDKLERFLLDEPLAPQPQGIRVWLAVEQHGMPAARAALPYVAERETPLGRWAEALMSRAHHNVAVVAFANKLARIAWAVLRRGERFALAGMPVAA
jgi:hypothetical protein